MSEFFTEYGMYLAKTLTWVLALAFLFAFFMANAMKGRKELDRGNLRVTHMNKDIEKLRDGIRRSVVDKHRLKLDAKLKKRKVRAEEKAKKKAAGEDEGRRVFVLDFLGDMRAAEVVNLRQAITAVLSMARPEHDEILLRLESPGGVVHGYGLAASQLDRIKKKGVPLTICVDKVAASGGYMMACLGDRVIAAPFAYIGSVGVVLQLPNFHRLLQDKNIDYEMITAGEYKRTLTLFGENTDKDRAKVKEEIDEAHTLFKDFIRTHRPSLNVDAIATGEVWFGTKALEKGLVDELRTSDEVILEACERAQVYHVSYEQKKGRGRKFGRLLEESVDRAVGNWIQRADKERFYS